jgi:hypothetical protein
MSSRNPRLASEAAADAIAGTGRATMFASYASAAGVPRSASAARIWHCSALNP